MPKVTINKIAPEFSLADFNEQLFNLSDLKHKEHVLLVFNRGFI